LTVTGTSLWFKQDFNVNKWFRFDAAARFDYMIFQDRDKHLLDTPNHSGTNYQVLPSYKLNFVFTPVKYVQLFINNGIGYHSNDTRAVVQDTRHILPMAFASEVGAIVRIGNRAILTASLYMLDMTDELVFSSDEATTENKGSSRRMGVDFTARGQLTKWLTADLDLNYGHNYLTDRFLGREAAINHELPLAPVFTSQGGLTARHRSGLKARVGYRAITDRPANEDNSVIAKGYCVMDALVAFERKKYQLSLTVESILNTKWNEAQFETLSKLRGEDHAVNALNYTAGTPISIKFGVSYFFR
jgi:outer membrane receptor protein involved in Fe transport